MYYLDNIFCKDEDLYRVYNFKFTDKQKESMYGNEMFSYSQGIIEILKMNTYTFVSIDDLVSIGNENGFWDHKKNKHCERETVRKTIRKMFVNGLIYKKDYNGFSVYKLKN